MSCDQQTEREPFNATLLRDWVDPVEALERELKALAGDRLLPPDVPQLLFERLASLSNDTGEVRYGLRILENSSLPDDVAYVGIIRQP